MFKTYYSLTKPGIIYGNLIPAIAGFFLASKGHLFNIPLFIAMIVGTSLIIGSGCVFNNYIDRFIDAKMSRTKHRALVTGKISEKNALVFGTVLGIAGSFVLFSFTNILTAVIGLVGFFVYVVVYGMEKRRSSFGTIVGSIAGATPPLAGYCAVTNTIDMGAILLFLFLVFWEMPHFYGIAMYRLQDYKAAGIPVLPAISGIKATKIHILFYTIAAVVTSLLLFFFGYTGYVYFVIAAILGIYWIWLCIKGFWIKDDKKWARQLFLFSLIILTALCVVMTIDSLVAINNVVLSP